MFRSLSVLICLVFAGWLLGEISERSPDWERVESRDFVIDRDSPFRFVRWESIQELPQPLAIYSTVFWDPADTESLRKLIRETSLVRGRSVLEIGTGSGLIALCCLRWGARSVVATDVNPAALACARDNARNLGLARMLETRLVSVDSAGAYAVIRPEETFDLIISNPPWENDVPASIDEFALYDPGFSLLQSIIRGARAKLNPGGRVLLAYGCTEAIRQIIAVGRQEGFRVTILDDRRLDDLEPVFLPGMLIELVPDAGP